MVQQVKVFATKLDNLSSIPENHMVERETNSYKLPQYLIIDIHCDMWHAHENT